MTTWAYEIIDKGTKEVIDSERGFSSESEVEQVAAITVKTEHMKGVFVRTIPDKNE